MRRFNGDPAQVVFPGLKVVLIHFFKIPMRNFGVHIQFCTICRNRRERNFYPEGVAFGEGKIQQVARGFLVCFLPERCAFGERLIKGQRKEIRSVHPILRGAVARNGGVVFDGHPAFNHQAFLVVFVKNKAQAMLQINKHLCFLMRKAVLMKSNPFRTAELHLYIVFFGHGIIAHLARFGVFMVAVFKRFLVRIHRKQQNIAHFVDACSAEAGLRKAHHNSVVILIAARMVPSKIFVVRTRLHHSEWHRRPGKSVACAVGPDKHIDELRIVLGAQACGQGHQKSQK